DRRGGLHAVLAAQIRRVDALRLKGRDEEIADVVAPDRTDRHHLRPHPGQIDARPARRSGRGHPDLLEPAAHLSARQLGYGPAEDVDDVGADAGAPGVRVAELCGCRFVDHRAPAFTPWSSCRARSRTAASWLSLRMRGLPSSSAW